MGNIEQVNQIYNRFYATKCENNGNRGEDSNPILVRYME